MDEKKTALIKRMEALGAHRLAEALYTLSERNESVSNYLSMLVSSKAEALSRVQNLLESIACENYFYNYYESRDLAEQLSAILEDIRLNITDPDEGLDIMAQFFEYDETIFEKCDDSNGEVSHVFSHDAVDLFVAFAARCQEKKKIAERLLSLFLESKYGVRTPLLERASEYLAEEQLLAMTEMMEARVKAYDEKDYGRFHALRGLEELARLIRNPALFESARLRMRPEVSDASCVDIARAYHECGYIEEALSWLDRIHSAGNWYEDEKDELLFAIYRDKGEVQQAEQAARRLFDRGHTMARFERLVSVIGLEHRDRILAEQTQAILEQEKFRQEDASFLIDAGRTDAAASHLIRWADEINGNDYYSLIPMAQEMGRLKEYLASTVIYRALLSSILNQALSKAYHHAAEYLRILGAQADLIQSWGEITPHEEFIVSFRNQHKRKWRFWKIYEGH